MVLNLREVLQQVGWSEGYHIPVANEENAQLEAEVERLLLAKTRANTQLENLTTRYTTLQHHKKCVVTEQESCQYVLTARQSQLDAEKNMYISARMEREHLNQDIRSNTTDLEKLDNKKQSRLSELNKLIKKLDDLKSVIQWDEQMIMDWEETLLQKDEDNEIIKKFSKEDSRKARELELKRQRLVEEEQARNNLTIRTANELENMGLVLARTVQTYKQMHTERDLMIQQWRDSIRHLQQRDMETINLIADISAINEAIETKKEAFREQKQFHDNEILNNKEIEMKIENNNADVSRMRKEYVKLAELLQEYTLELGNMKRELRNVATSLQEQRFHGKNLSNDYVTKSHKLNSVLLKNANLATQEEKALNTSYNANERAKKLEEMITTEELLFGGLLKDIERMQGLLYRSRQTYNKFYETGRQKTLDIKMADKSLEIIVQDIQQLKTDIQIQTEVIYKLNFRVDVLENKLAHLSGAETIELADKYQTRIKELEKQINSIIETSNLLQSQIEHIGDVMHKLNSSIITDNEKLELMKSNMKDYVMMVTGGTRHLQQYKNQNNELRVQENMLKVRLKYAERLMQQENSSIYNLRKQLLELETMMKERQAEISMNRDILITKKRSIEEEKDRLKADIILREIKIEQLKKRQDCILSSLGQSEDGEALSITYFKIKNAQEKYMMQKEGDKLDNQIKKAEKEIIAMENTLRVVNFTNETYKKNLAIVEDKDDEQIEMEMLQDQFHKQSKALRQETNQFISQKDILLELQHSIGQNEEKKSMLQEKLKELENHFATLKNEADHRKEKLKRAYKQIKRLTSKKNIDPNKEKDFITRHLKDSNRSALQQLTETSVRFLETAPVINHYLSERNIPLKGVSSSTSFRSRSTLSQSSCSTTSIPSVNLNLNIPF